LRIKVEKTENITEPEIVLRFSEETEEVRHTLSLLRTYFEKQPVTFYKDGAEVFFPVSEVLFFETEEEHVVAHTKDDVFRVKHRLYDLEQLLPSVFVRCAKSTLLNVMHVSAIRRAVGSGRMAELKNTHKQAYISRGYAKSVTERIETYRKG